MPQIKITLKSDLCNANGEGFASVIDTDIVADEYGIPFIPARRIKGCLREAAEDIEIPEEMRDAIFGQSGSITGGSLKFSSPARLDNYDSIKNQAADFSREEVLNLFTYTRAATAIDENGSADENSLRFMRVVKQYLPDKDEVFKPLVFIADCELDEQFKHEMKKICLALRNIGYKRNRGFGAVTCEYIEDSGKLKNNLPDNLSADDEYIIPITLINETPLIISAENNDETLDYIPGGSLLAAFASLYPKDILEQDFQKFSELFLRDNVRFSNCYIGDMPAPLCYAGMKKDKKIYINLAKDEKAPEGDAAKPLKNKYLTESEDGMYYNISEIKKEIIYHNDTQEKKLYTQTALCEGQEFKGTIAGRGEYLNQIKGYFKNESIRVGKSKTAQYSVCSINFGEAVKSENKPVTSDEIAVILKSDVLLIKDGVYTTDLCELKQAAGIPGTLDSEKTAVAYTTVSGYSGVYNLKKPQAKAFKAGSVLIFKDVDITKSFPRELKIGARQSEGFGLCEAIAVADMKNIVKNDKAEISKIKEIKEDEIYRKLLKKRRDNTNLKKEAIDFAKDEQNALSAVITSTQIGRLRRMMSESENAGEFKKRIENIKTESIKDAALKYFNSCRRNLDGYENFKLFWDTVLLFHRFQRKIDEKKEEAGGK